jgi:tryptophan-rich hypothetical protein
MNKVSPKSLLHSKWTKTEITNKEKHFAVVVVEFDEDQAVIACVIEALINHTQYTIDWRELKNSEQWRFGWQ